MHAYKVGDLYHPDHRLWPEFVQYSYRGGQHELVLFLRQPSPQEVQAARTGRADFALVVEPPVLLLCYRFSCGGPWSDAPFSWHLVPASERATPPDPTGEERATLQVVLVDAATGLVQALRLLSFAPPFTAALHRAIRAQALIPWEPRAFDATLSKLYSTGAPDQLAERSEVRCRGGE
ncbi:MAG: hypothetical protein HY901_36005 [Deltaproteobacteria bacterium]|nr:hypothetical protein [Deltaproteobacteria bacterium]